MSKAGPYAPLIRLCSFLTYIQDWPRHKKICRADATREQSLALSPAAYTDDQILASLPPEPPGSADMPHPDDLHKLVDMHTVPVTHNFANEYSIDVRADDGSVVRMHSTTLSADEVKRMKILAQRSSESGVYMYVVSSCSASRWVHRLVFRAAWNASRTLTCPCPSA